MGPAFGRVTIYTNAEDKAPATAKSLFSSRQRLGTLVPADLTPRQQELLVPNKEFITGRLLNWSLSDRTTRIIISVGIAYGSNPRQAMDLLEEAARENEDVLEDPTPSVIPDLRRQFPGA